MKVIVNLIKILKIKEITIILVISLVFFFQYLDINKD